jgi:glycosyltransferase involved in cell wall biosynthesis
MSPMKLLIYTHFFAPSVGGVENAVESLARGLAEVRGPNGEPEFEITLVTHTSRGDFDDGNLPFRMIREPGYGTLLGLVRRADLLHIAGPSLAPLCLAWYTRTPAVVEHHGYQATCLNGVLLEQPGGAVCPGHFLSHRYDKCLRCFAEESSLPRSMFQLLTTLARQFLVRRVSANLAITHHVMTRQGLPRTQVVYYGIEDPLAAPNRAPDRHPSRDICFAYVGRLVREKGLPVLLRAASLLRKEGRHFSVLLIGDGEQRRELEKMIQAENLSDTVRVTGYLRGEELASQLQRVDVVVMPSLWEETAGLAAIEQMMRGRLVIASAIGGLREIVEGRGLTFPAGNETALAERMRAVVENPFHFDELGQRARERSLGVFHIGRMIEEHAIIYRRIWQPRVVESLLP